MRSEKPLLLKAGKPAPKGTNDMFAIPLSIKRLYRKIVPVQIRNSPTIGRLKTHDMIYDSEYYATTVEGPAVRSAKTISNSIFVEFAPKRVVDIGCGTGALLEAFRERGCEVFGLEYSDTALKYCSTRHLNVAKFDLERDLIKNDWRFDVAVSMEVAEHLPEKIADRYVDALTRMAPIIVFTAAPPGQAGADHVNLQPPQYWILKFRQRGFDHAEKLSERLSENWKAAGDVETWYHKNLMIFQRNHV
jgi:SAM-dependent methyltransferase